MNLTVRLEVANLFYAAGLIDSDTYSAFVTRREPITRWVPRWKRPIRRVLVRWSYGTGRRAAVAMWLLRRVR